MVNIREIITSNHLHAESYKELKAGYSSAKKYKLYSSENKPAYLLKIYDIGKKNRIKLEFELLNKHYQNKVLCQNAKLFGYSEKEQICYLIFPYIKGTSSDMTLPELGEQSQYKIGVQAGRELRKIHLLVPDSKFNWYQKRFQKYQDKLQTCEKFGLTFYNQKFIEDYINENIYLLKDSPVVFQHDDFHPQNIIIKDEKLNGIIDFDSFDWGDPWEEFFKLPKYTIQTSVYFAKGQVTGYFDHKIPDSFWRKYNLFVALNQHASQISGYLRGNLKDVQERTRYIIETHDFNNNNPPEWFVRCRI